MRVIWSVIERVFATLAVIALFALVVLPFTQVVMRDAFNAPVPGLEEATRWGLIGLVYLALPLLVSTNEQIRFSEIVDRLPGRARTLLERGLLLVAAACLFVLIDAAIGSALKNANNRTPMLNIPFRLFIAPMVIGLAVSAVGALYFAFRRTPPPVAPPEAGFLDREPEL
ncbi:TRAP transporter small permease [Acuticoccus sp. I52.16.1]|uniref:TRAP transporter small permease n=1 Tax=Acuticoccus sp. I52.16.1 TaxID=2928472 RepID=UPI001FCF966D|nr:TRAP transporter small permease subunit [Acuticoccus sp. I52.16.1]UOM35758.1 TRAP transporter small permease subunit [Acuticoccus sp. I52.16.1]